MLQVKKAFEHHSLLEENRLLRARLAAAGEFPEMIGQSAAIREVFEMHPSDRRYRSDRIDPRGKRHGQGVGGSGHPQPGPAPHRPVHRLECGALPETLIESELFGYEKGAFSGAARRKPGWFEMAQRGTLFLDEVGEMAPKTQVDLLRVLEQQEVRRWAAASSFLSTCGSWPRHIVTCKSCSPRASCDKTSTTA